MNKKQTELQQEIQVLQKKLQEQNQQQEIPKLQRELQEKEAQLNRLKRQEKKLQKVKAQRAKGRLLESFSSGKISWIKNKKYNLYPTWDGYYNNKLLFKLEQKFLGYNLTLLVKNSVSSSFVDIQKKAEELIESLSPNAKLLPENKENKKKSLKDFVPLELKLPKYFQEKLIELPENGTGYQEVHLLLFDDSMIYNAHVINGEKLRLPPGAKVKIEDIKDII